MRLCSVMDKHPTGVPPSTAPCLCGTDPRAPGTQTRINDWMDGFGSVAGLTPRSSQAPRRRCPPASAPSTPWHYSSLHARFSGSILTDSDEGSLIKVEQGKKREMTSAEKAKRMQQPAWETGRGVPAGGAFWETETPPPWHNETRTD